MQTLEDLLRAPPSYPEGLVGRNVSLAGDHEAASQSAATNDSFPVFGGVGYNAAEEGGAAAAASTANATQTADCEQVSAALTGPLICTWRIRPTHPADLVLSPNSRTPPPPPSCSASTTPTTKSSRSSSTRSATVGSCRTLKVSHIYSFINYL